MQDLAQQQPQRNRAQTKSDADALIVAEWPINQRGEAARVSIDIYKGAWLINLRKWFAADDGELRPGKGFAVSVKHLPALAEAFAKALTIARERGLVAGEP